MFTHRQRLRHSTAFVLTGLLLIQTTGCATWNPVVVPAAGQPGVTDESARYRVNLRDGRTFDLGHLRYRSDSVVGLPSDGDRPKELGFPLANVVSVEKQGGNAAAAVLLGAGMIAIVAGMLGRVGASSPPISTGGRIPISCPLVYSWDGSNWHLDSGTFGGAITPALGRTDMDNLLFVRPINGLLRFRMTDEAEESEHVDAFTVVAVDHPAGTDVAPDARANNTFHVIEKLNAPRVARDFIGRDVLSMVKAVDSHSWESAPTGRDPANPAQLRDGLDLVFNRPNGTDALQLVVDAQNTEWSASMMQAMVKAFGRLTATWYDSATTVAASAPMARAQHGEGFLQVSVFDGTSWRPAGEIWEAGPEVAKRQVLPIDVSGIAGDSIRVRLESAPSFWRVDFVGLGRVSNAPVVVRDLPNVSADAPRVNDAIDRIANKDGRFLDMERGDTVTITVRDTAPAPTRGMVRSYLSRTSGWYRVHGNDTAAPDVALLTALGAGAHAPARLAVTRMNAILDIVRDRGSNAPRR